MKGEGRKKNGTISICCSNLFCWPRRTTCVFFRRISFGVLSKSFHFFLFSFFWPERNENENKHNWLYFDHLLVSSAQNCCKSRIKCCKSERERNVHQIWGACWYCKKKLKKNNKKNTGKKEILQENRAFLKYFHSVSLVIGEYRAVYTWISNWTLRLFYKAYVNYKWI